MSRWILLNDNEFRLIYGFIINRYDELRKLIMPERIKFDFEEEYILLESLIEKFDLVFGQ